MHNDIRKIIHDKVASLAREMGNNASALSYEEEIPASGLLDSTAIMELILWIETRFGVEIHQESLTIENFGTIEAIARFLGPARGA